MDRRSFLKLAGFAGAAVVMPSLVLPKPRTVLRPDATLFLPPPGGWLAAPEPSIVQPDAVVYDGGDFGRKIVLDGEIPVGAVFNLWSGEDGEAILLNSVAVDSEVSSVTFTNIPRGMQNLRVTASARSVDQVFSFPTEHWGGDFTRHVCLNA